MEYEKDSRLQVLFYFLIWVVDTWVLSLEKVTELYFSICMFYFNKNLTKKKRGVLNSLRLKRLLTHTSND